MKIGSLFSGYGGLDIAVQAVIGGDLAWYSEIEPAACKVLTAHHSDVPNLGDITKIDWTDVEPVDILTGGYPCQPFSQAGKRKGTNDERHLWPYVRDAIDALRPGVVVLENVRGHLTLGFGDVLADLSRVGYDARWGVVRASDAEAPHQRARLFIVAYPHSTGLQGHNNDSGETPTGFGGLIKSCASETPTYTKSAERRGTQSKHLGASIEPPAEPRERTCITSYPNGEQDGDNRQLGRMETEVIRNDSFSGSSKKLSAGISCSDNDDQGRSHQTDFGPYSTAIRRWEHLIGRVAPVPSVTINNRPRLNPVFVEWMMGLPKGHVTGHGLSNAQALRMLGNGVVPQQATLALRMLGL